MDRLRYIKIPKFLFIKDSEEVFDDLPVKDYVALAVIFIIICRNESKYENISNISIGDIFNYYGFKMPKDKPKAYYTILNSLKYLELNKYIEVFGQVSLSEEPSYKNIIRLKINNDIFSPSRGFFELYMDEIYALEELCDTNSLKKDIVFTLYMYIRCKINLMSKKELYCKLENICSPIGYTEAQIKPILQLFVEDTKTYTPLLSKEYRDTVKNYVYKENKGFMKKDGHNLPIVRKF